jgi:bacterioferritin
LSTYDDRIEVSAKILESQTQEDIMKGDPKLLQVLNSLLADELTAINQYMVHSEMCDAWGYEKLHKAIEKRAIDEMKHAEKLIGRILYLEGLPIVSELKPIHIGEDVPKMFAFDHKAEEDAIKAYNDAIALAGDVKDSATGDFLQSILNDEDEHMDEIEEVQDQIKQMSLQIFLTTKVG